MLVKGRIKCGERAEYVMMRDRLPEGHLLRHISRVLDFQFIYEPLEDTTARTKAGRVSTLMGKGGEVLVDAAHIKDRMQASLTFACINLKKLATWAARTPSSGTCALFRLFQHLFAAFLCHYIYSL